MTGAFALAQAQVCGFWVFELLAYFLIYSCLGWCVEVVYAAVTTGQLVNRGFLNGPVCPIYGFGMTAVLFVLAPLQDNVFILYLGGVALPSIIELAGGWVLYRLYHTRWWDYSDYPFNLGGYICLEFSLLWGIGTLIMVKMIHPTIAGLVWLLDPASPSLFAWVLLAFLYAVYAADVIATAISASALANELEAMEKTADSLRAVSDAMTELLGTTAMDADQKMDESRLQLKLAAAEMRDTAEKYDLREALAAMRAKADAAAEAARKASAEARLNASEAANAAKLAAADRAERAAGHAAALLNLQQLSLELKNSSRNIHEHTLKNPRGLGRRRLLRAFPAMKHGEKQTSLNALRERLGFEKESQKTGESPK